MKNVKRIVLALLLSLPCSAFGMKAEKVSMWNRFLNNAKNAKAKVVEGTKKGASLMSTSFDKALNSTKSFGGSCRNYVQNLSPRTKYIAAAGFIAGLGTVIGTIVYKYIKNRKQKPLARKITHNILNNAKQRVLEQEKPEEVDYQEFTTFSENTMKEVLAK